MARMEMDCNLKLLAQFITLCLKKLSPHKKETELMMMMS